MLDPFLPENPDDVERLKKLQREIHEDFIALVKSRRGGKLAGPENDLFSGEYWTGRRAIELGLVDAIGDLRWTLRERFGDKVFTPLITAERRLFGRRVCGIGRGEFMAAGLAEDMISALEARALVGALRALTEGRNAAGIGLGARTDGSGGLGALVRQGSAARERRARHRARQPAAEPVDREALPTLKRDPQTGEYRPELGADLTASGRSTNNVP